MPLQLRGMDAFEPALLSYYLQVEFDTVARERGRFPGVYVVPRASDPLGEPAPLRPFARIMLHLHGLP